MKKLLPLLTLLLCLLTAFTYAQGIVKGTVTDKKNGDPLAGSTITIKNQSTGATISTGAVLDGTYTFKNLADGKYEITAKYISYNADSKTVSVNGNVTVVN